MDGHGHGQAERSGTTRRNLPEHRDGRETPFRIGVVQARDPEGEAVRYALASGDASRFTLGSSNGIITYVGPGEDYEAGPREYELRVTARDDDRRTAGVAVLVRVTDTPEAPVAADDAVETAEDEVVEIGTGERQRSRWRRPAPRGSDGAGPRDRDDSGGRRPV